jgi:hypothetical protein
LGGKDTKVLLAICILTGVLFSVQLVKADQTTTTINSQLIVIDDRDLLQADVTIIAGTLILLTITSVKGGEAALAFLSLLVLIPFAFSAAVLLIGAIFHTQSFIPVLLSKVSAIIGLIVLAVILVIITKLAEVVKQVFRTLSGDERLSKITIQQVLDKFPSALQKVMITDKVKDIIASFGNLSNVLVLNTDQKPMGILYKVDFLEIPMINDRSNLDKSLIEFIDKIQSDFVTKRPWDKQKGVKNFAYLSPDDSLLTAKQRMYALSGNLNDVLGIVIDPYGNIVGRVGFDMLIAYTK